MNKESQSKQELLSTISRQADQIKRYENRLRDVVAAYKGLSKEKEALEVSLNTLTKSNNESENDSVAALTHSLATVTSEKSRMEEAFQNDKKITREKYENTISGLREEMKALVVQHQAEINSLKAKISYEMQERDKDRIDHGAMLKEMNLKFNADRMTKEKLEDKFSAEHQSSTSEMEKRVRDLSGELEAAQRKLQRAEARAGHTPQLLVRLQEKMALLEQTHSVAIREEQIKAKRAEESARKICAKQEERVALLEERLAELSATVGEYDARRRKDLHTIQQLRESLNTQILDKTTSCADENIEPTRSETDNDKLADSEYLQNLIDKIHILKKELISENEKLGSPVDIAMVFGLENYENIHVKCVKEYEKLKKEFDSYKCKQIDRQTDKDLEAANIEISKLLIQIAGLKESLEISKCLLEDEKLAKTEALNLMKEKIATEREHHKLEQCNLKDRIHNLEKQLQIQRERHSALLEETDQYIRCRERNRKISTDSTGWKDHHAVLPVSDFAAPQIGIVEIAWRLFEEDSSAPPHMLHYAHELARKDLDISQLRKDKHLLEGQLRDCQREATIEKERFKEVVRNLKEEIDRLRRIQSREGANLEYLKNVVLAYLMSTDYAGKKHMLNAISAVLHFTDSERKIVYSTIK